MKSKKNKGITLVALVVTIVILLILAGISIAALSGDNGLFGRAKEAQEKSTKGEADEQIKIVLNDWQIEKISSNKNILEFLQEKSMKKEISEVIDNGNDTYEVTTNGGYSVILDKNGVIIEELQKKGPKPQVSNIKVVKNSDGTGEMLESESAYIYESIYIRFDVAFENGEINKVTCDTGTPILNNGTCIMNVTNNGRYIFKVYGSIEGQEVLKTEVVLVNQYNDWKKLLSDIDIDSSKYTSTEEAMDSISKDKTEFTKAANDEKVMKMYVDLPEGREAMYNNATITESVIANSNIALTAMKTSSQYQSSNSPALNSSGTTYTLYNGKAFIFSCSAYSNRNCSIRLVAGNFINGNATITGNGSSGATLNMNINKFGSTVTGKRYYGYDAQPIYMSYFKI